MSEKPLHLFQESSFHFSVSRTKSSFDSLYVMAVFSSLVCNSYKYHFGWVSWSHKKWGANFRSWLSYWQQSLNWQSMCVRPFRKEWIGCMWTPGLRHWNQKELSLRIWCYSTCYCSCSSGWKERLIHRIDESLCQLWHGHCPQFHPFLLKA